MLWAAVILMAGAPGEVGNAESGARCSCISRRYCHGAWLVQQTPNFRIWSRLPARQATALAEYCEASRTEIHRKWTGQKPEATWVPKCEVVVHSTIAEYNRALSCVNNQSVGCTTLKLGAAARIDACRRSRSVRPASPATVD